MEENINKKELDNISDNKSLIKHFGENTTVNYKKLKNVKVHKMNRINIFTGKNNTGKTSLLEVFCSPSSPCRTIFLTPNLSNLLLKKASDYAIEINIDRIVRFIQENLDSTLQKIEKVIDADGNERFMVTTSSIKDTINIIECGFGLQRVFEIALLIMDSKDGIACIDDIEYGIHKDKFLVFTKFIQEIAEDFNVQIFLTTLSKECVDAFVLNGHDNDSITAYNLKEVDGQIDCKYISGERLKNLVMSLDFDIR